MKPTGAILLPMIFVACSILLAGDQRSLFLGSVDIRLGASKELVLQTLRENYDVSSFGPGDNWSVRGIGSVSFRNGKVVLVSRTWADWDSFSDPNVIASFETLCDAMSTSLDGGAVSIAFSSNREPSMSWKQIVITKGTKKFTILVTNWKDKKMASSASLIETLEE